MEFLGYERGSSGDSHTHTHESVDYLGATRGHHDNEGFNPNHESRHEHVAPENSPKGKGLGDLFKAFVDQGLSFFGFARKSNGNDGGNRKNSWLPFLYIPIIAIFLFFFANPWFFAEESDYDKRAREWRLALHADRQITAGQLWRLAEINWDGRWIEVTNPADCPLDKSNKVFCRVILHPGQELHFPRPDNATCHGSKASAGLIGYSFLSVQSGWTKWYDLRDTTHTWNPRTTQYTDAKYSLFRGVNTPQAFYMVRLPIALAKGDCLGMHFKAVWATVY